MEGYEGNEGNEASLMRKARDICACLAWRKGLPVHTNTSGVAAKRLGPDSFSGDKQRRTQTEYRKFH